MNEVFRWVFVCTGNRCRSPYAERYIASFTQGLPVDVTSRGTLDLEGLGTPSELIEAAYRRSVDLSDHRSQPVDSLSDVDLVVGFELSHVAHAVIEARADPAKTFVLPELARLLSEAHGPDQRVPVERAREMVAAANGGRRHEARLESIADPFGGPAAGYRVMVERVSRLCDEVLAALFPATKDRWAKRSPKSD